MAKNQASTMLMSHHSHGDSAKFEAPAIPPLLFLDYDGVLHPDAVYRERGRIVLRRTDVGLFEWAPLLVQALSSYPDVRIVLSTSWVRVLSFDRAKSRLPSELREKVIGATYHSRMCPETESMGPFAHPFFHWTRYEQIVAYVQRHRVAKWLAIDDDDDGWGEAHRAHLVATDSERGIFAPGTLAELETKLARLVVTE